MGCILSAFDYVRHGGWRRNGEPDVHMLGDSRGGSNLSDTLLMHSVVTSAGSPIVSGSLVFRSDNDGNPVGDDGYPYYLLAGADENSLYEEPFTTNFYRPQTPIASLTTQRHKPPNEAAPLALDNVSTFSNMLFHESVINQRLNFMALGSGGALPPVPMTRGRRRRQEENLPLPLPSLSLPVTPPPLLPAAQASPLTGVETPSPEASTVSATTAVMSSMPTAPTRHGGPLPSFIRPSVVEIRLMQENAEMSRRMTGMLQQQVRALEREQKAMKDAMRDRKTCNVLLYCAPDDISVACVTDNSTEGAMLSQQLMEEFEKRTDQLHRRGIGFALIEDVPFNTVHDIPFESTAASSRRHSHLPPGGRR